MSFGVVSSGARSPYRARGGRLCRADASPEAGLIRCYATASAVKRKIWCFRCAWLGNGDLVFLYMCTAHALSTALLFILAGV